MWSLLQRMWWLVFTLTINWSSKQTGKLWASSVGISGSLWILIGYDVTDVIFVSSHCQKGVILSSASWCHIWYIMVYSYYRPVNQSSVCLSWQTLAKLSLAYEYLLGMQVHLNTSQGRSSQGHRLRFKATVEKWALCWDSQTWLRNRPELETNLCYHSRF